MLHGILDLIVADVQAGQVGVDQAQHVHAGLLEFPIVDCLEEVEVLLTELLIDETHYAQLRHYVGGIGVVLHRQANELVEARERVDDHLVRVAAETCVHAHLLEARPELVSESD